MDGVMRNGTEMQQRNVQTIISTKCNRCQQSFYPTVFVCPSCSMGDELSEDSILAQGTVRAYYLSDVAQHDIEAPYAAGIVRLDDGVDVFGRLEVPQEITNPKGACAIAYVGTGESDGKLVFVVLMTKVDNE